MPLEFITESNRWKVSEALYDRVRKCQRRGKGLDNDHMNLLIDLGKYLEWQRYVAGRRDHKWDDNARPMVRDRNGYTDSEMIQDFKKLNHRFNDDRYPIQRSLISDAKIAHEECEIRQFEVDELEICLQHKLEELEKAHELFRDRMCEIKRQAVRVRSTVRARPRPMNVSFPPTTPACENGGDQSDAKKGSSSSAEADFHDELDLRVSARAQSMARAHAEMTSIPAQHVTPPILKEILELAHEDLSKGEKKHSRGGWKRRWSSMKKSLRRNNN